jgi:hypothetical protein
MTRERDISSSRPEAASLDGSTLHAAAELAGHNQAILFLSFHMH